MYYVYATRISEAKLDGGGGTLDRIPKAKCVAGNVVWVLMTGMQGPDPGIG